VRAAFAYIRSHRGATPSDIKGLADALKSGDYVRRDGRTQRYAQLVPGIGVDKDDNTTYEFPLANLQAADAEKDGRALRLMICGWFGLPEYMVTSDASNANFSSTLVAETPGLQHLRSWQEYIGEVVFAPFIRWLMEDANLQVSFTWPQMLHRSPLESAQANEIEFNAGVISRRTWQERVGVDPEIEAQRLADDGGLEISADGVGDGESEIGDDELGEQTTMSVQSLIFRKDRFTVQQAIAWAKEHDFRFDKVDEPESGETIRLRQFSPDECIAGSLRTSDLQPGVQAVVCRRRA